MTDRTAAPDTPALRPLRLRARDADDLTILSAALQDAIVSVGDMAFLEPEHLFVLVANRFRWEDAPETLADGESEADQAMPVFHRTHCGLRFAGVRRVAARGLDLADRGRFLNLLAIEPVDGAETSALLLTFAGGAQLRLEAEAIDVMLEDRGDPWPTTRQPRHEIEDGGQTD